MVVVSICEDDIPDGYFAIDVLEHKFFADEHYNIGALGSKDDIGKSGKR